MTKPQTPAEKKSWLIENFGPSLVSANIDNKFISVLQDWNITAGKLGGPVKASGASQDESVSNLFDRVVSGVQLVNRQSKNDIFVSVNPKTLKLHKTL